MKSNKCSAMYLWGAGELQLVILDSTLSKKLSHYKGVRNIKVHYMSKMICLKFLLNLKTGAHKNIVNQVSSSL